MSIHDYPEIIYQWGWPAGLCGYKTTSAKPSWSWAWVLAGQSLATMFPLKSFLPGWFPWSPWQKLLCLPKRFKWSVLVFSFSINSLYILLYITRNPVYCIRCERCVLYCNLLSVHRCTQLYIKNGRRQYEFIALLKAQLQHGHQLIWLSYLIDFVSRHMALYSD